MPRNLGAQFIPLQADERRFIELAVWTLEVGVTIRAANYDLPVTANVGDGTGSQLFAAVPWTREPVKAAANLEVDEVTITFPNTLFSIETATPIMETLGSAALTGALDGSRLKIYIINLATMASFLHSDWWMTGAPTIERNSVAVQMQSGMCLLTREAPKTTVHAHCNNALYDEFCTVDEDAWIVGGVAEAGNAYELYDSMRVEASGWFNAGRVMMLGGDNFGSVRTVLKSEPGYLLLMVPFNAPIAPSDQYVAWPGCDKRPETCRDKFFNLSRYRGFPHMPPFEIMEGF